MYRLLLTSQRCRKCQKCSIFPKVSKVWTGEFRFNIFVVTWPMIGFTRYHDMWYPPGRLGGHFPLPLTPQHHCISQKSEIWDNFHKKVAKKPPKQIAGIGSGIVFVWKHVIANWTHIQPPWNSCKKFNRTHKIQDISQNTKLRTTYATPLIRIYLWAQITWFIQTHGINATQYNSRNLV